MSIRFRADGRRRSRQVFMCTRRLPAVLLSLSIAIPAWSPSASDGGIGTGYARRQDTADREARLSTGAGADVRDRQYMDTPEITDENSGHCPPGLDAAILILGGNRGWPVWANGRYLGRIPVRRDSMPPGPTLMEIGLPPGEVGWFRPWPVLMGLTCASVETLRVEPLQRLRLQSLPPGATARSGDVDFGRTPVNVLVPSRSMLELSFQAPGHTPLRMTYDPGGRPDSFLIAALIPGERMGARTVRSDSPWITRAQTLLPVVAVILGGSGIWARHRADAAYSGYLTTVDRTRMNSRLDRAGKYDRLASACWISAEVCVLGAVTAWVMGSRRSASLVAGVDARESSGTGPQAGNLHRRNPDLGAGK